MQNKQVDNKPDKYTSGGSFKIKIGKTTYEVCVFFNKNSKVTVNDKIKRLISQDVKNDNF